MRPEVVIIWKLHVSNISSNLWKTFNIKQLLDNDSIVNNECHVYLIVVHKNSVTLQVMLVNVGTFLSNQLRRYGIEDIFIVFKVSYMYNISQNFHNSFTYCTSYLPLPS